MQEFEQQHIKLQLNLKHCLYILYLRYLYLADYVTYISNDVEIACMKLEETILIE